MLDLSKYDDLFEIWEWSVYEDPCEYEDIIKNIHLYTEKTSISGKVDSWGRIRYYFNFSVSISLSIKYKTIGDKSGWLISGKLSSECMNHIFLMIMMILKNYLQIILRFNKS